MVITRKWIFANRTDRGAWNCQQLKVIGVAWPPRGGWIERCVGQQISQEDADLFAALGSSRLSKNQRRKMVAGRYKQPTIVDRIAAGRHAQLDAEYASILDG